MTAITGFNCNDGIVLAADTEETYQQDKAYSHKLFPVDRPNCNLCVAGSGVGYLIDYAKDKIVSAVDSGLQNSADFETRLISILDQLYREDFRLYPVDEQSQRQI